MTIREFIQRSMPLAAIGMICSSMAWGLARGNAFLLLFSFLLVLLIAVEIIKIRSVHLIIAMAFMLTYFATLIGLPAQITYMFDGLILIFFIFVATRAATSRQDTKIPGIVFIWIVFLVSSALINSNPTFLSFQSLIAYLLFPLLYLGIVNVPMTAQIEMKLVKTLIVLVAVQLPIAVVQKIVFYQVSADRVGGTLGMSATSFMAVLMACAWVYAFSYVIVYHKQGPKAWALMILPFIPMIAGATRAGYVFTLLGGISVYLAYLFYGPANRKTLRIGLWIPAPIVAGFVVYKYLGKLVSAHLGLGQYVLGLFSSWEKLSAYFYGYNPHSGAAERLEGLIFVNEQLAASGEHAFGRGIGLLSSSALLGLTEYQATELTTVLAWVTSASKMYFEIGLIGFFIFCLMLGYFMIQAIRLFARTQDLYLKTLSLGFVGATVIFFLGGFYSSAWKHDAVGASFWICAALVTRVRRGEEAPLPSNPLKENISVANG